MDKKQSGTKNIWATNMYRNISLYMHIYTHTHIIYTYTPSRTDAKRAFDFPAALFDFTSSQSSGSGRRPRLLWLFACQSIENFSHCRALWPSNRRLLGRAPCVSDLRPQRAYEMLWTHCRMGEEGHGHGHTQPPLVWYDNIYNHNIIRAYGLEVVIHNWFASYARSELSGLLA